MAVSFIKTSLSSIANLFSDQIKPPPSPDLNNNHSKARRRQRSTNNRKPGGVLTNHSRTPSTDDLITSSFTTQFFRSAEFDARMRHQMSSYPSIERSRQR